MRAMAPNADLRPFHSRARSASSAATRTVRAPCSRPTRSIHPTWCGDTAGEAVDLHEQHGGGVRG